MKLSSLFFLILCALVHFSCLNEKNKEGDIVNVINEIVTPEFDEILNSADVTGSVLIYDPQENNFFSNDFSALEQGYLPASTFKIPNSLIALETGLATDSTLFKWNGKKRRLAQWEQDLIFRDAFHLSCVPCYQEIAGKIGADRMNDYLGKFDYGNMIVDSLSVDIFWLEGDSKISPKEQITFLQKFYTSELPLSENTVSVMKRLMVIDENELYTLSGKTGWSVRNGNNNGWFVGYLENETGVYFISVNINPNESFNMSMFAKIRSDISLEAFRRLGII